MVRRVAAAAAVGGLKWTDVSGKFGRTYAGVRLPVNLFKPRFTPADSVFTER